MTTASDVIAALNQRRTRRSLRPETPGALPGGWQRWLDALPRVDAHAAGAPASALLAAMLQRPLRPIPRRPALLGRWQAFASLLQQQWQPDLREERGMRIGAGAVDIFLHLILASLLLWLMYLRLMMPPTPADNGDAVQVEFIGRGNLKEGGGARADAGMPSAPAAAAPSPAPGRPDAGIATVPVPPPPRVQASREPPRQLDVPPPAAAAAQPLQVSQARDAEPVFRLPPPKPRDVPLVRVPLREVQPVQQVEAIPDPPQQPVRALQAQEIRVELRAAQVNQDVQSIEIPTPQRLPTLPMRATPAPAAPQVQVPQVRGQLGEIPMPPDPRPTSSAQAGSGVAGQAASGAGAMRATAEAASGSDRSDRSDAQAGRGVVTAGAGAGSGSQPAPGGWVGPAKSDDWGASTRNLAGTGTGGGRQGNGSGTPGLFNDDGSPRLADGWSEQAGIDLDRAGTWLKRPGLEYKSTRFDQYWVPGGTLLEEWVRKGIRKVAIPIPGSSRQLRCVVSLLPPGAVCNPFSPDVNEQPARARPPPDIPFKPGLQEDNGSVKPSGR